MKTQKKKYGIASAGNWLVDYVKIIDTLPGKGMLGTILTQTLGTGGAPFNVLVDLSKIGAKFPLTGIGLTGNDTQRNFIIKTCKKWNIDTRFIMPLKNHATSFTDVMTDSRTGERIFYHCRGANAYLDVQHIPINKLTCRIFHLGYLLLLDTLDKADKQYGTRAARLLAMLKKAGIKTSVDVVSEESQRFSQLVPPALKYTDYLILNEIEAARTVAEKVRDRAGKLLPAALKKTAEKILKMGNMELVIIHMPEGAYCKTRDGRIFSSGSLELPQNFIKGTVGAGDAFCAGVLYGLHEQIPLEETIKIGICTAASCLMQPGATDGVLALKKALELGKKYKWRKPPA
jgi:sugar/nucleoside kinase (ribokinase family)